jgi:hypothetical protein
MIFFYKITIFGLKSFVMRLVIPKTAAIVIIAAGFYSTASTINVLKK